jgi:uncharacterized Tic20 family protein
MLLNFTISISLLVLINFLLLKFSCNKTVEKSKAEKQINVLKPHFTKEQESETLAPTGS